MYLFKLDVFIFFGCIPRKGIPDHMVALILVMVLFSGALRIFYVCMSFANSESFNSSLSI